jgi:site-specific DNA-methyltransferase (adenine-specific)
MTSKRKSGRGRLLSLQGVERNAPQKMDAVELLSRLPDRIASLVICDPQYRTVLDHLKFGNEGARQKGRAKLPQMSDDTISFMIEESQRVLKPSGHIFLWTDKFSIGTGQHLKYLRRARLLQVVDIIVWDKMRIGMGRRARCVTEFMVVIQKAPIIAKGVWTDHGIKDFWSEAGNTLRHPHAKPHVLMERLIRAVTLRNDLVIDPCAGGYGSLDACRASGREFVGCDLIGESS